MSPAPKVSVFIASYNGERYIAEAVNSNLGQSWTDLEVVVVDDGSKDGTRAILREIAARDPRLRVIEKENEGQIATLNRCIAECRGAYLARLDHDDISLPGRIEKQARFLDANPDYIGVGCLIQNLREDGTPIGKPRIREEELQHRPADFPPRQQWLYGPTPMIRAEFLRKSGGYRAKFTAAEDRDLCWRLGDLGRLARLPEPLVGWRQHDNNMSDLRRRTQVYSDLLGDLSAIARHFGIDDGPTIDLIEIGGNYAPAIEAYKRLLSAHYPVETYLLFSQMRRELWDLPGGPDRKGFPGALIRHVLERPLDPRRLFLLRRAALYLSRKPRGLGGHRKAA